MFVQRISCRTHTHTHADKCMQLRRIFLSIYLYMHIQAHEHMRAVITSLLCLSSYAYIHIYTCNQWKLHLSPIQHIYIYIYIYIYIHIHIHTYMYMQPHKASTFTDTAYIYIYIYMHYMYLLQALLFHIHTVMESLASCWHDTPLTHASSQYTMLIYIQTYIHTGKETFSSYWSRGTQLLSLNRKSIWKHAITIWKRQKRHA